MRTAFAGYAWDHEVASIRRCWSTWNVLCTFLYTSEQLAANAMQIGRAAQTRQPAPQGPPPRRGKARLETVAQDQDSKRETNWTERISR